jgi:zinc and cadmium transporter
MEPIIAAFAISLLSLVGVFVSQKYAGKTAFHAIFLPLSIGLFLGVTFFELLPEAFEAHEHANVAVVVGFLGFLLLSRLLYEYHHHHTPDEHDAAHRGRGSLILIGDGVHNLADGVVIVAAFAIDPALGVLTTFAVALHEIPQEIAEYSVLLSAGYSRARALFYNFLSASSIIVGALASLGFMQAFESSFGLLLGLAAGNLLYIAASDLLPELVSEKRATRGSFVNQFALVCLGCALIGFLIFVSHEELGGHAHEHEDTAHETEPEHSH